MSSYLLDTTLAGCGFEANSVNAKPCSTYYSLWDRSAWTLLRQVPIPSNGR